MSIQNIYFIDIETVPCYNSFDNVPSDIAELFEKKNFNEIRGECNPIAMEDFDGSSLEFSLQASKLYKKKSALSAEFGKICSVSIGKFSGEKFYVKTITDISEVNILQKVSEVLQNASSLCAHNGLEFDYPFMVRRYMINGLKMPPCIDIAGKKPWEIQLEDTMKMWSVTQWNYKVSLDLLANVFGLPSPKEFMNGASVAGLFYGENQSDGLEKIKAYNAGDVVTLANVYCKMKGFDFPKTENIIYV